MITLQSHGKTILTGEHAVIRGAPAVVIPNHHQALTIRFDASKPFKLTCHDDMTLKIFESHLPELWQMGQTFLGQAPKALVGEVWIENTVPIARGCGFSAAFSVVVAKLLHHVYHLTPNTESLFKLSLHFEMHFHGSSSGADIAGAMSTQPIWFQDKKIQPIQCHHKGYFYLFDSDQISHTKKCVSQVSNMNDLRIDDEMSLASGLMIKGLENTNYSLELIAQSIHMADACFQQWGLITPEIKAIQDKIKVLGGIASKVTGAGGGGYVLGFFEHLLANQASLDAQLLTINSE